MQRAARVEHRVGPLRGVPASSGVVRGRVVCATDAATKLIRSSDLIEVDCTAGLVTIIERA